MTVRWRAVAAITASLPLRSQLRVVEQHCGWDFAYTDSIRRARRCAHHRPMIIIGADLLYRVRDPLTCGGAVVVATLDLADTRIFEHAERIHAGYVVVLPQGCPWLIDMLLQSHRWCGMPAPHPPGQHPGTTGGQR